MTKVAVNGFGRIGRITLRATLTKYPDKVKMVAINTSGSMEAEGWAQLFEYDSVYGKFKGKVTVEKGTDEEIGVLVVNHQRIPILAQREPAKIPWKKYDAEVVIESTGVFREKKAASAHLKGGAQKVIISAPAKDSQTYLLGVNEEKYKGELVINMGSCTTNCLAPIAKIILNEFGVQKAHITTVHAYTADQELVDGSHRDLRRARAAGMNIVPTSTGAALATAQVLPALKGIFDGLAFRVPIICGSVADFSFLTTKRTSAEEVNRVLTEASQSKYKRIVDISDQPLVSTDIIGNPASAVVDLSLTKVIDGDLVKLVAWYDNEWAFCCRLIEMATLVGRN